MSEDIFSQSTQEKLSDIFGTMTQRPAPKSINEGMEDRVDRRAKGEGGVQQWSRGDIFPVTIVVKGINDSARVMARHGNWNGEEHYVKNDFQTAHRNATADAIEYLEAKQL